MSKTSENTKAKGETKDAPKAEAPAAEAQAPAVDNPTRKEFDGLLAAFRGSTQASMKAARRLADISLEVFAKDGNLQYVYDFIAEIDKTAPNYVRKGAYMAWLCTYAPITYDKGLKKLVKDKSPTAVELNVEKALKTAFWEFKPDRMTEFFTTIDLIESLKALVKRHQNGTKLQPANAGAAEAVKKLEAFVETLAA